MNHSHAACDVLSRLVALAGAVRGTTLNRVRRTHTSTRYVLRAVPWLVVLLHAGSVWADDAGAAARARALEERLHAPCCRHLMLESHESEPARALRAEIRERLGAGESVAAVERDLVARYGESIIAVPVDADPRPGLSLALGLLLVLSAAGLFVLGVRWVRRERATSDAEPPSSEADELDALGQRLEEELRQLEA